MPFNGGGHDLRLPLLGLACQAYEYDALSYLSLTEYYFTEIFISGQQNRSLAFCRF
jgi:hypothetical protein